MSRSQTASIHSSTTAQTVESPATSRQTIEVEPTEAEIQEKPWKYVGYRGYSEFISSDDDLFILRRFGVLNTRIALSLQDKVCELEQKLSRLDKEYSSKIAGDFNNATRRNDLPDRAELIDEITTVLTQYNTLILQQSELRKYPTAPRRDVKNIINWHYNHGDSAIAADERQYLEHGADLVSLAAQEKTPLRRAIDNSQRLRTLPLWRQMRGDDQEQQQQQNVAYFSSRRLDGFASGTIVVLGVAMLLTPLWVLQALEVPTSKLLVITVFVLVFLLTMSFTMAAKPFEALGATAAYAAVLMVFLQIDQSG